MLLKSWMTCLGNSAICIGYIGAEKSYRLFGPWGLWNPCSAVSLISRCYSNSCVIRASFYSITPNTSILVVTRFPSWGQQICMSSDLACWATWILCLAKLRERSNYHNLCEIRQLWEGICVENNYKKGCSYFNSMCVNMMTFKLSIWNK